MNNPLVTIAIPIFNAEKYLCDSIQSCINQTYQNWELLLMCDGCTDASVDIAREMAKKDSRLIIIDDGVNRGLIYRLNESVKLAKGVYYARMDADDIMATNRIEEEVNFLNEHSDIDVVGSSIMLIDERNNIRGSYLMSGNVLRFVHPTVMGRTTWFKENPYAEWALRAEDFELWVRTSMKSRFYSLEKPLLFYREFGSHSFYKNFLSQKTLLRIYGNYRQYNKSFVWCVKNRLLTLFKIIIYALFAFMGGMNYLVKKRRNNIVPLAYTLSKEDLLEAIDRK